MRRATMEIKAETSATNEVTSPKTLEDSLEFQYMGKSAGK